MWSKLCFVLLLNRIYLETYMVKVRFRYCIDKEDIRRWYVLHLHIQEDVLESYFF